MQLYDYISVPYFQEAEIESSNHQISTSPDPKFETNLPCPAHRLIVRSVTCGAYSIRTGRPTAGRFPIPLHAGGWGIAPNSQRPCSKQGNNKAQRTEQEAFTFGVDGDRLRQRTSGDFSTALPVAIGELQIPLPRLNSQFE